MTQVAQNDLEIRFENPSYKIISFTVCYDCHSGISFDINCKDYSTAFIKQGDKFINGTRKGDQLVFDCIVLSDGKKNITTKGVMLNVID